MKSLKKRLVATALCALLPTLNISLGGILPETAKINTEMMTALAADSPESIFDDSLHGQSDVTNDASIRNADPYGTASGQWNNVYTVPEVYGIYTGKDEGVSLHDVNEDSTKTYTNNSATNWQDTLDTVGIDIGNGKDDIVAGVGSKFGELFLSLSDPTTGGAKVDTDFQVTMERWVDFGTCLSQNTSNVGTAECNTEIDGEFNFLSGINANVNGMFMSIAAGDFDGSGQDTIIAYIPEWGDVRIEEYKIEKRDASELSHQTSPDYWYSPPQYTKYIYSGHYYKPVFNQKIVDNVYNSFGLQTSSVTGDEERQRDIPLVNLVAADIDKDGRDELIVTAGLGSTTCTSNDSTTKMRIYDYYNGEFHETYTLELTGTYNNKDGLIRYASSAVGNVDVNSTESGVDFPEIVTAGWVEHDDYLDYFYGMHVTRVQEVKKENDGSYTGVYEFSDSDKLTSTYSTTWESLDIDGGNNLDGVSEYMKNGLHPYGRKAWNHHNKLAVGVVSALGSAEDAQIVLGDTIYAIDETNKLQAQYRSRYGGLTKYSIQKVLTGAFEGIYQGAYFLFADENNQFHTTYCYYDGEKWVQQDGILQEDGVGTKSASICNVDIDNDGLRIKLNKVTQGWGDTKPIFVLEAAPYFDELHNSKYGNAGDIGSTSITNSYSEGSSGKYSAGISASLEVGVTGGFSICGNEVFHLDVGGYYEAALTYSGQTNTERTLEITHANNSGENAIIVARAPYYIYEYQIDGSDEKFYVGTYGSPQVAGISVDKYNELAKVFNERKDIKNDDDRKILLIDTDESSPLLSLGTPGDPYSYRETFPQSDNSDTSEDMRYAQKWLEKGDVNVGVSSYNSKTSSTKELTYSSGAEHGFDVELGWGAYFESVVTDVKVKVQAGANVGAGYCKFHSSSVKRSGTGANYYNEAYPYNNYDFNWDFGFWDVEAYTDKDDSANDSKYISVLGYTVSDIKSPTVAPKDFKFESQDGNTATFSWELPEITGNRNGVASYVLRLNDKEIPISKTQVTKKNNRYYYTVNCKDELKNKTDYTCTLSCVTDGNGWESVPSDEVKLTTNHLLSVNITAGKGLELLSTGGKTSQETKGAITTVYYRLKDGYEIPSSYSSQNINGLSVVVGKSDGTITISGTPTSDTEITIPDMNLKNYTISYTLNGGTLENRVTSYTVESDTITLPTPVRAGYEFTSWTDASGNAVTEIPAGSTGDKTFTANWKESENTAYTVEYYLQGLDEEYPDTPSETAVFYGKTGETISVSPKAIEGFTKPTKQSVTIKADGTAVVKFEYARKSFTLTIEKDTGIKTTGSSSNGMYYYGTELTLKATVQSGYRFAGWSTDEETIFSEDAVTTFTMPAGNITIYAMGEQLPDSFEKHEAVAATCETDGNIEYYLGSDGKLYTDTTGTPLKDLNSDGNVDINDTVIQALGHSYGEPVWNWIEPHYDEDAEEYVDWTFGFAISCIHGDTVFEETDLPATKNSEIPATYTSEGSAVYTATYTFNGKEYTTTKEVVIPMLEKTAVIINSVDINGISTETTVYAEIYTSTDYTVPDAPYLDGYDFKGWNVNDMFYTTAEEVQSAVETLVKSGTAVTVNVVYEQKIETFKVTVTGGTIDGGVSGDSYQIGTELTVTAAPAEEEYQFDHWENNGEIASYNEVYSFHVPAKEVTLEAVYSPVGTEVEKVGTAFIESVTTINGNKIAFVSKVSIPEGARILRAGIVANTEANLNGSELTTETAQFTRYDDSKCYDYLAYKFTWTKSNVSESDVWCVRSYLVYSDENGEEHTVYGDLVKADLNGVITEKE
ncbi:MAG: InlB B-repeat-containing protein [Oscillospiraceae bacterium]|nr:InlB B-repeat-containing protein [Oscillospiraceae bacterium]